MTIEIPVGGSVKLTATYVDAASNPTVGPVGAGQISWSDADPSVISLDTAIGATVTVTARGSVGATGTLTVTDGSMTSSAVSVVIVAGPAVALEVRTA